jgi:chloramphenicol 3-O phosphotransferase
LGNFRLPYALHTVRVTCPPEVLLKREQARKDRCPGSAEASYIWLYPKDRYDLTVDTNEMTAERCAEAIDAALFPECGERSEERKAAWR